MEKQHTAKGSLGPFALSFSARQPGGAAQAYCRSGNCAPLSKAAWWCPARAAPEEGPFHRLRCIAALLAHHRFIHSFMAVSFASVTGQVPDSVNRRDPLPLYVCQGSPSHAHEQGDVNLIYGHTYDLLIFTLR